MTKDVLRQVPPDEAIRDWDFYEKQIKRVIERADGGQSPDGVLTCVQLGSMQIWRTLDGRGMAVTELQNYPLYRQLLIYMVAGEGLRDWMHEGHQQLERFAKSNNCTRIEFHGRPGWERWAYDYGYTHKCIRMKKRL